MSCLPVNKTRAESITPLGQQQQQQQQLAVGDSDGIFTMYSGEQVLSRRKMTDGVIMAIHPCIDRLGQVMCIVGGSDGLLSANRIHDQLWRAQLGGLADTDKSSVSVIIDMGILEESMD